MRPGYLNLRSSSYLSVLKDTESEAAANLALYNYYIENDLPFAALLMLRKPMSSKPELLPLVRMAVSLWASRDAPAQRSLARKMVREIVTTDWGQENLLNDNGRSLLSLGEVEQQVLVEMLKETSQQPHPTSAIQLPVRLISPGLSRAGTGKSSISVSRSLEGPL